MSDVKDGSIVLRSDDLNNPLLLVSRRDVKTQYGVQIWWKDPKQAGAPQGEWDFPRIAWFDDPERAHSYYLTRCKPIELVNGQMIYDDPPELGNDVARLVRYTRRAIEVYGEPEET